MNPYDYAVRAFRVARFGVREAARWRALSETLGVRPALFQLIRERLSVGEVTDGAVAHLADSLAQLQPSLEVLKQERDADRRSMDQAAQTLALQSRKLDGLTRTVEDALRADQRRMGDLQERATSAESLFAFSQWIAQTAPRTDVRVSVILATRNRAALLPRAVATVLSQQGVDLELVIVDDGSTDDTAQRLAGLAASDSRIVVQRLSHSGSSAARNRGLQLATGSVVAYVDDDNWMAPGWLKAVVWAFGEHPEAEVLYGARLVEKGSAAAGAARPFLQLEPFDRSRLEAANYIDLGALAHRAHLAEARFDEALPACVDWDLVLRLTRARAPLMLPVLASAYSQSAPDRISERPFPGVSLREVQGRHQQRRLRILAYNAMFPLLTEAYVYDELKALERNGAELSFCREYRSVSPMPIQEHVHTNLESAVREIGPDLLFLHWTTHALEHADRLERLRIHFAVRVHSFDFNPASILRLQAHPFCVGVWAYPQHARQVPGTHSLMPQFTSVDQLPAPADRRDLVLAASAGLPKKDWPTLIEGLAGVRGAEVRMVVGITNDHEAIIGMLTEKLKHYTSPPLLQVNLTRPEVLSLMARAAVVVYGLDPRQSLFGMPMSIVEGMAAGACIVAPERAEAREMVGRGFRGYTSAGDMTAQIHDVLKGGARVESERAGNRARAHELFCNPTSQRRFFDEVWEAWEGWKARSASWIDNGFRIPPTPHLQGKALT